MIKMLVDHIICAANAGKEELCTLRLDSDFPGFFYESFHSLDVRQCMQRSVAAKQRQMQAERLVERHDREVIGDEEVEVLDESLAVFELPQCHDFDSHDESELSEFTATSDESVALVAIQLHPADEVRVLERAPSADEGRNTPKHDEGSV